MRKRTLAILVIILFSEPFLNCSPPPHADTPPLAKKGVLDLQNWDFQKRSIAALSGEWYFYWEHFLPQNSAQKKPVGRIVNAPGVWNTIQINGQKIGSHGYATYQLQILLPETNSPLYLRIPDQGTAYELYANGDLLAGAGKIGTTKSETIPYFKPQIAQLQNSKSIDLILYVSNFHNRWGGYWYPIQIGNFNAISSLRDRDHLLATVVGTAAGVMAIFNFVLFLFRKKDKVPLFLALHNILILIRSLTTDARLGYEFFPNLSWEFLYRLEYLSVYLSSPVLLAFMNGSIRSRFWKKYNLLFMIPYYVTSFLVIFFPNQVFTATLEPIEVFNTIITAPLWLFILAKAVWSKVEDAILLLVGYLAVNIAILNDILHNQYIIQTGYLIPYGELVLIFIYSTVVAKRSSLSFVRSEGLSERLKVLISSTQKIMLSTSAQDASRIALQDLSNFLNFFPERASVYFPEKDSPKWKHYTIQRDNNLVERENVTSLVPLEESVLSKLEYPTFIEDRILLPIKRNDQTLAVLEMPVENSDFLTKEADLIEGISYALALALQNLIRLDREKLAVIGELASQIVHDIGHHTFLLQNLLNNIIQNAAQNPRVSLDQAKRETDALTNLSLDILDFAKNKIVLDKKEIEIERYFLEIKNDLELFFQGKKIELKIDFDFTEKIKIDPFRIRRMILNLAKNAEEAMGEEGIFSIRIAKESGSIYLIFEDNGPGISEDAKRSLYEPLLESKKSKGAGLGLSIVRKIVLAHGGEILVDSEPGKGSRFTVLLPD